MATVTVMDPPEPKRNEIEAQALALADKAREMKIASDADYVTACEGLKAVARTRGNLEDAVFEPQKKAAYKAWRAICDNAAKILKPLDDAVAYLKGEIRKWDDHKEQERQQLETQKREQLTKRQEDEKVETAAELEREGRHDEAEQVLNSPSIAPPVVQPKTLPQVQGVGFRDNWKVEVTDLAALVRAVADGKVPIHALQPDQSFLDKQAKAYHGVLQWPGCRPYNAKSVSTRTK